MLLEADLKGFSVVAEDGYIGKVEEASNEVGASYLIVDVGRVGRGIFGKLVMLPATSVTGIDRNHDTVSISETKAQVKAEAKM